MVRRNTGRPAGKPTGATPTSDIALFSLLHRTQAQIHRDRQRLIVLTMKRATKADPDWQMPAAMRVELQEIDTFLSKASSAVVAIAKASTQAHAGLTTEQLEAQLRAEMLRACGSWTDEEWNYALAVRAARKKAA
jgi:hypothetical protein